MNVTRFEKRKFNFERDKFNKELELRKQELALKEKETLYGHSHIKPTHVTIWVAVAGILGTALGSWLHGQSNQKLERQKFESAIILKVAAGDSIEQNKEKLRYLLNAGLISDQNGKIGQLLSDNRFNRRDDRPCDGVISMNNEYFYFYNTPLINVISEIERRHKIMFLYDMQLESARVNVEKINLNSPLPQILNKIFKSSGLEYQIVGNSKCVLRTPEIHNTQ